MSKQNIIGIGRTAETFITKQGTALKLFYDFIPKAVADYEYAVAQEVAKVCTCVPAVYALVNRTGRTGIEYELIRGRRLVDSFSAHPLRIKYYARRMGELHRMIHSNPLKGLKTASDIYEDSVKRYPDIKDDVRSMLLGFLRQSKGSALCHGDFHPENILVSNSGDFKVIDWINVFSGDPLADVARTYYCIRSGKSPEKKSLFIKSMEIIFRRVIAKEYIRGYFKNKTVPKKKLQIWDKIIRIHRYYENIHEEKEDLIKTIKRTLPKIF